MKRLTYLSLFVGILLISLPTFVSAQAKYNIKTMTPEVNAALENRRARYDQLRSLKAQGVVGETNKGYVEVLVSDQLQSEQLAAAENKDRKIIYETIAEQNNLKGALATIEEVFAQVQRDKAEPGDKIQDTDGHWIVK